MPLALVVIINNVLAKLNVEQAENRVEDPLKINLLELFEKYCLYL